MQSTIRNLPSDWCLILLKYMVEKSTHEYAYNFWPTVNESDSLKLREGVATLSQYGFVKINDRALTKELLGAGYKNNWLCLSKRLTKNDNFSRKERQITAQKFCIESLFEFNFVVMRLTFECEIFATEKAFGISADS